MSKFVPGLAAKRRKLVMFILATMLIMHTALRDGECLQSTDALSTEHADHALIRTVEKGDTLYDIAGEYQVSLRELMKVNNLTSSLIIPGQILVLPGKTQASSLSRGDISREDLLLLARLIHAEARGESFEGQIAVGAVILNRVASPYFPKTIREVVYQKNSRVYQFSPVGDGSINLEPDEKAVQAAVQALQGKDPTGGALFFYNPDISRDKWIRTLPVITKIGNHVFASANI